MVLIPNVSMLPTAGVAGASASFRLCHELSRKDRFETRAARSASTFPNNTNKKTRTNGEVELCLSPHPV